MEGTSTTDQMRCYVAERDVWALTEDGELLGWAHIDPAKGDQALRRALVSTMS
jgi:hypothetical protein